MKNLIKSMAILIAVLLMASLASCQVLDEAVQEATATLTEKITTLEGQLSTLNSEITELYSQLRQLEDTKAALEDTTEELEADKDALESDIAELESEKKELKSDVDGLESDNEALKSDKEALESEIDEKKVELECAKGNHVIVEGGEYTYTWKSDFTQCMASYFCKNCESEVSSYAYTIDVNENGEYIAGFGDFAPQTVYKNPIFTGVSFNSDSEAYDAETNTFTVSPSTPLIITFTGTNLDNIVQDYSYMLGVFNNNWVVLDYIPNSMYGIFTINESSVILTFTHSFASAVENSYGSLGGLGIFGSDGYGIMETVLELNMSVKKLPVDEEGFMLVSDAEELEMAIKQGGMIRLANDIESANGFEIKNVTIIDLAGHYLKVTGDFKPTFWIYANCVLTDSVGGSRLYKKILVNRGTLSLEGAIEIEGVDIKINGSGTIDFSRYTGGEMYLYLANFENIILPDGYAFFNDNNEGETTDFATAKEYGYGYVRPVEQLNT